MFKNFLLVYWEIENNTNETIGRHIRKLHILLLLLFILHTEISISKVDIIVEKFQITKTTTLSCSTS